jgi:hypothetical protein
MLRVFTILPSKQVTIILEIKLHSKANLSNGKGDNSIITENTVNSPTTAKGLPTQSTTRRPSDPWVRTHLLSHNRQRAVEKSQAHVDNRLLGLPSPYHRYAIGMFNTCSRGPTERYLIDTGGCYNLGGAGLPHTHFPTFPTSCPHFPLVASPGLYFNQILANRLKC